MSISRYYNLCQGGIGRPICITTVDGRVHRGIIERVTREMVYLRPLGRTRGQGGFGYGFWGWGFGWGIALGAIAALAFIPWFI